jgi:hypothetical protein
MPASMMDPVCPSIHLKQNVGHVDFPFECKCKCENHLEIAPNRNVCAFMSHAKSSHFALMPQSCISTYRERHSPAEEPRKVAQLRIPPLQERARGPVSVATMYFSISAVKTRACGPVSAATVYFLRTSSCQSVARTGRLRRGEKCRWPGRQLSSPEQTPA